MRQQENYPAVQATLEFQELLKAKTELSASLADTRQAVLDLRMKNKMDSTMDKQVVPRLQGILAHYFPNCATPPAADAEQLLAQISTMLDES